MEQETMEQETPAKLSLEDEVRHLISCLNQHLGDSASKIFGEVPVNSSLKRLHDLLQSILGDNQTGPEGSHACDIEARVALRRKDCFDALLQVVLEAPDDGEICQSLTSFGGRLLDLGFELVDEARRFIVAATTSTTARTLLYSSATSTCSPQTSTCSPPVFTFDLAQYGHASLEFSELTQPFPGIDGAQGYTVMFWMRIDRFDDACHTTLFGACDPSHTCFLLLYLDRKHHSLILQTSVTSSQPSVRFREVKFEQHMLYHVALVHRRSRQEGPGKALLYVNGILREQARCPLPKDPESMPAGKGDPLQAPTTPVRAFFGTPRDLSPSPQPQTLHSKWSLASGHLINDTLTEDLVYMHHKLGPTYRGNLQDSLGSFLTYQASTMVNLRDEQQRQDDGTPSILSEIFKSPGKPLSLETLFVLSLSPAFAGRALSVPHPQTETFSVSHPGPSSGLNPADLLVLNAAVPSKKRALEKRAGTGTCQGGVMLQNNLSVQDCSWRLAGSIPVALHFVATAKTIQGLIDATLFFFRMCTSDWRNSEATERSSGFGVLSWLLQQKVLPTGQRDALTSDRFIANISIAEDEIASQSLALLDVIVHASTAGSGSGEEAIVINPLAYRMLVIDNELWQHTGAQTQVMLYSHLLTLTCRSKHRDFNIRRLLRMRKTLMRHLLI